MRRCIATVCLSGTLDDKLAAAARAGFNGVELFESDLVNSPLPPAEVRHRAEDLGLSVDLYQPFRDFESVAPATFERNLRRAEAKFDVMEQLGAPTMLVCSNVSAEAIDDDALAAEQLHALATRAADRGLNIAYEALAWGRHVHRYEHSWRIASAADHPALGVCLDSFHILSVGSDLDAIADIPGDKILYLQLADAPHLVMEVLQWSRHYRCFPGQGAFDIAGLVQRVLMTGYAGPLSLEVFNDVFRQADADRTAVDAMRSVLVLEDQLGQSPLPSSPQLDGFAFVEIGVDAASAPDTEALLGTMGFARVGPHRSKPVHLWQHGAIRIVLNHGVGDDDPEVVAVAVESAHPGRSEARAEALLAPVLDRPRNPGEADLSAVAAPDGTSVFFCRTGGEGPVWLDDFLGVDAEPEDGAPAVPIERIDHIALAQPFEAFDEAALFYRSVLDLRPGASAELAAPHGLVRSRAVASADRRVRIALNVPALAGTRRGQAELQHVAFSSDDVIAAARAMRERGAPILKIPDNYYEDLEVRFDLDRALLIVLRELGVLYDRSPEGELLHFYSAHVGGRMFFEVLERRGAYDGYGAVNSPVRMAAQRTARAPVA
jgi:4-hydroxyphenylpyruvate dioxygenase